MKKLLEWIEEEVAQAFEDAGYDRALGVVTPSNRRDLCEFQCNGAMAGAKKYHKAPLQIAEEVASKLQNSEILEKAEPVKPGFLNLTLKPETIRKYVVEMMHAKHFGAGESTPDQTIVIDYGGPNVAKPLHVGHLRAAIIGESLKRIFRYTGNKVIGDIHMGDWGLQMGLILTELKRRQPDLPYFDPSYTGEYPKEAPLPFRSWKKSTRQLLRNPRKMKHTGRKPWKIPESCRMEKEVCVPSGITSSTSLWRISNAIMIC